MYDLLMKLRSKKTLYLLIFASIGVAFFRFSPLDFPFNNGNSKLSGPNLGGQTQGPIDPNFGPGFPTFNPQDPSTFWLSPENNPQTGGNGPSAPIGPSTGPTQPGNPSDIVPGDQAELCNSSIRAIPAGENHQIIVEAQVLDLNKFTFVRISWPGGAEVIGMEFLNSYGRNAFLLTNSLPKSADIEIFSDADFAPESLICSQETIVQKAG
jgi:hypothetical protein